jgi:hypothetical protein
MLYRRLFAIGCCFTPPPTPSPAKLERGRQPASKSPLHWMETYAQHTRDYSGEVNHSKNGSLDADAGGSQTEKMRTDYRSSASATPSIADRMPTSQKRCTTCVSLQPTNSK